MLSRSNCFLKREDREFHLNSITIIAEINYNITSLIDVLGLVQGLFLGIILIVESRKQKPTLILGFFLIAYSIELLNSILDDLGMLEHYPQLLFLPIDFFYLTIPLFYIYINYITGIHLSRNKIFKILFPGIFEFLFFLVLCLLPVNLKSAIDTSTLGEITIGLFIFCSFPYSIYYVIKSIRHINKAKIELENTYSNTEGKLLNWAKGVLVFILTFNSLWFIEIFQDDDFFDTYTYPIMAAINVVFIFWAGISGLRQSKIFGSESRLLHFNESQDDIQDISSEKTLRSNLDYDRLVTLMVNDKLYKEPNLSLIDVAKLLQMPARSLSKIINENSSKNFNQFVNYYRVEEAKKLLKDSNYNNLTILGIAYDAGFSSKASFYSVFKKFTKNTPNTFKTSG